MSGGVGRLARRLSRTLLLLLLVSVGTIALMRLAPGYYTDAREMDAQSSQGARNHLESERRQDRSVLAMMSTVLGRWLHGDLGQSRQYDVPVTELIRPRLLVTGELLARGIVAGWFLAFAIALPLSARRGGRGGRGETMITASSATLLAIPVGALATFCLMADTGGPALALTVLIGARNFKFLYRLLRRCWRAPYLLQARAQGISPFRIALSHLIPMVRPQLLALATMSMVIAFGAVVPIEVIFNVPGVGQLAWSAAMNRDLPVLLAVTLLMASAVSCAGMLAEPIASGRS